MVAPLAAVQAGEMVRKQPLSPAAAQKPEEAFSSLQICAVGSTRVIRGVGVALLGLRVRMFSAAHLGEAWLDL